MLDHEPARVRHEIERRLAGRELGHAAIAARGLGGRQRDARPAPLGLVEHGDERGDARADAVHRVIDPRRREAASGVEIALAARREGREVVELEARRHALGPHAPEERERLVDAIEAKA